MALALLLVLLVLLGLSAYFSATEAALFSLGRLQQRQIAQRQDRGSRLVIEILRRPERALSTLLVGNNLTNIAFSSLSAAFALQLMSDPAKAAQASFLVATLAVLIFAEITPKTLAVNFAEGYARAAARSLLLVERVLRPLAMAFYAMATGLLRLLRIEEAAGPPMALLSRAELRSVFEEVDEEAAEISPREGRIVQNILDFATRRAEEIMTPRVEIDTLDETAGRAEAVAFMRETRHSRYPVFRGDPDNVVGFVAAKEYLADPDATLAERLRPVVFYPENAPVDRIFREMQRRRRAMAIVVNEYGEVVGLITREDLVEEIVGDIYDEFDLEEPPIRRKGDRRYILHGRASLHDLNEALHEVLPIELPDEVAVTLNGFLCEVHGHIPRPGAVVTWGDLRFHVLEVARHQVRKVLLELPELPGQKPGGAE